jgi:nitroreductase
MNSFKELVTQSRSIRRFKGGSLVDRDVLLDLVDLARVSPSAANKQPLKYFISSSEKTNDIIFPHLSWAAYLKDWIGPSEDERPGGYICICLDKEVSQTVIWDHAIAAQTILLGAVEQGLGGCIIGAFNSDMLGTSLGLSERYAVQLVLAIGEPGEEVVMDEIDREGSIVYWRDDQGVHHVPKRRLEDIIVTTEADDQ